jgi:hypothetical protein
MPREQLQARCDPDTIDEVQQLADEKGISKRASAKVRRSVDSFGPASKPKPTRPTTTNQRHGGPDRRPRC